MAIYAWLLANYEAVLAILMALHGVAVLIVNLTPTPKDDAVLAKVYRVIELLAGIISTKAKN